MKRISILMRPFTGDTTPVESDLVSVSGYLAYSDTIGGGLVTDLNVREFLDNPTNEGLATSFFNFLKTNTVTSEFNAIFYNDQKLANTFNDFYSKTILGGEKSQRKDVVMELSGSSAHTYTSSDFISDGTRSNRKTSVMTFINTGHSYYIPVEITLDTGMVETSDFSKFHKDSFGDKQTKRQTLLSRYAKNVVAQLPNPANAVVEYESFQGPLIGRSGVDAFKFKDNKYVSESTVPAGQISIDLVFQFPVPTTGQTIFIKTDTAASTAIFGVDFDMNDQINPSKTYKKFYLNVGQIGLTTNIRIFDSFKNDVNKSISLILSTFVQGDINIHGSNIMAADDRPFTVINRQPPLLENKIKDVNEVIITTSVKNQKLLQGFVDYNFDDNESEFWRNSNVKIVRDGASISTII